MGPFRTDGLTPEAMDDASMFAAIAPDLLLGHVEIPTRDSAGDPFGDRRFVDDRPEIHQAVGMVSVQLGVDLGTALLRLRARAFTEGRPLSELAAEVVTRTVRFDEGQPP